MGCTQWVSSSSLLKAVRKCGQKCAELSPFQIRHNGTNKNGISEPMGVFNSQLNPLTKPSCRDTRIPIRNFPKVRIQNYVLAGTFLLGSSACDQPGSEARCQNNSNMANSSTPGFINSVLQEPPTTFPLTRGI